ncbi:hypothetical protein C5E06_10025 [Pseudoclavibacter sp. RFBI5]|uniref:hypothetical protein n=1 Tax=Pseudoclavibacter sp. RFBI5 TaxID=2080578 RepID=UPI000CE7D314|nr:hypothetical protein [Pseudoclavibacter sp. RFBI5]PPG02778.1 hypothetical protein C5E06_10025 [Pseudoclavibacter sp. RFBI5]
MSTSAPAADARRESARGHGARPGQFGFQDHSAPAAFDPGSAAGDELSPVAAALLEEPRREPQFKLRGFVGEETVHAFARAIGEGDYPAARVAAAHMSDEDQARMADAVLPFVDGSFAKPDPAEWDDFELSFKAAFVNAQGGRPDLEYLADAGEASKGYMGGSKFEGHLARATHMESRTQIAKRIRGDITAAQDAGYLPAELKVSVRQNTGAGVSSFSVTGTNVDQDYLTEPIDPADPDYVYSDRRDTEHGRELALWLEVATSRYTSKNTNSQVDFFQSYHDVYVRFD